MRKAQFFLSALVVSSLLMGLPPVKWIYFEHNTTSALAATIPLAETGEGTVLAVINQSGQNPDILVTWFPDKPQQIVSSKPISGLQPGEKIGGMDFDNLTAKIIGVTNIGNVIFIDPKTGAAMKIIAISSSFIQGKVALDFDSATNVLRILSEGGLLVEINFSRIPPIISLDTPPIYAADDTSAGKTPKIVGLANNKAPGSDTGKIFVIDSEQDVLAALENFKLKTIGRLGVNTTSRVGFSAVPGSPFAFAALQLEGEERSKFFLINLDSGLASELGSIGVEGPIEGLSLRLNNPDDTEIMITPSSAKNPVGTDHTVTATVKTNGKPVAGAIVLINIGDGPNKGLNVHGETEDDPDTEEEDIQFKFTYTSNGVPGVDSIEVAIITPDGKIKTGGVSKEWFVPQLTFNIENVIVKGKKLSVVGCCFTSDDTIFINDKKQNTQTNPDNPTTVLTAKKGGKKLKACDAGFKNRVFVRRDAPGQPIQDTQAFATCP